MILKAMNQYTKMILTVFKWLSAAAFIMGCYSMGFSQESPKEEDFFRIARVTSPEGTLLEEGG